MRGHKIINQYALHCLTCKELWVNVFQRKNSAELSWTFLCIIFTIVFVKIWTKQDLLKLKS
jgi:hypothetical protein